MKLGTPFCKKIAIGEFEVNYDPHFTTMMGVFMAAVFYDGSIFVTDLFLGLSEDAQKFVLYHEEGHAHYDHMNKFSFAKVDKIADVMSLIGYVPRQEAMADDFAVKKLGYDKAIRAMKETIDVMSKSKECFSIRDVKLRYRRVLKKGRDYYDSVQR